MPKQFGDTKVFVYPLGTGDGDVAAKVYIGEGQHGGWAVFLDGKLLKKGSEPDQVTIGKASKLKGRQVVVNSVVIDVRPETNRLSVTTEVTGGAKKLVAKHSTDGEDGSTANYVTVVVFS